MKNEISLLLEANISRSYDSIKDDFVQAKNNANETIKFKSLYILIKQSLKCGYFDIANEIINYLDKYNLSFLNENTTIYYYRSYLNYYFFSGLWEKAIQYIYLIESFKRNDISDIFSINYILSFIYNINGLLDEAIETMESIAILNEFSEISYTQKTIFYIRKRTLKFKDLNEISQFYSEPKLVLEDNIPSEERSIVLHYITYYNFFLEYIQTKDIIHKEHIINQIIDYVTHEQESFFIGMELDIISYFFLCELRKMNRMEEAIKCTRIFIKKTIVIDIKIKFYELLKEFYNHDLPLEDLKNYNNELYKFHNLERTINEKNLRKQIELFNLEYKMHDLFIELSSDPLTGYINKRHFVTLIDEFIKCDEGCSLIMFKIDNMDMINKHFGTKAGDTTLKVFANVLKKIVNRNALFCRYSNSTFCLVITKNDKNHILDIINKVQKAINNNVSLNNEGIPCTFIFGYSIYDPIFYNCGRKLLNRAEEYILQKDDFQFIS